jgi:hypothetical protein
VVRGLMYEAALKADEDPDRLSFLHGVRVMSLIFAVEGFLPAPPALLRIDHLPMPIDAVAVQPMKDFSAPVW